MALAAGRVGVSPQDVDNRGHITAGGMTPEQAAKLDRALVAPITAPLEKEFVGVGTGNEQIMVKVGDGLELSGATSPYTLKATESSGMMYTALATNTSLESNTPVTMLHDAIVTWRHDMNKYAGIFVNDVGVTTNANRIGIAIVKAGDVVTLNAASSGQNIWGSYTYLTRE